MDKLLVILGPTATGKTDLALYLAKKYNGELVSCDSRQVYRGLDIGTGKLPNQRSKIKYQKYNSYWKINNINVWMLDLVDPKVQYTVFDYVQDAWKVIRDISKRGKLPIVVGGTGLYLRALLEGLPNLSIPIDQSLRGELEKLSKAELQEKLKKLSPDKWESLNQSDRENPRRLLRSIELVLMYGHENKIQNSRLPSLCSGISGQAKFKTQNYEVLKIGLMAAKEVLNNRIDLRVLSRLDQGLIEEAEKLHQEGLSFQRMRDLGLEYGVLADLLEGKLEKEEFIKKLQIRIHQYAKRQMTWFRNPSMSSGCINWFDVEKQDTFNEVEKMVYSWYHLGNDQTD